jgi:hypothetical protein
METENTKQSEKELSYGEKAVGITFNPSNNGDVDRCKIQFANLINQMDTLRKKESASSEQKRLASVAITEMQTAQMWAVKALTWKD